jgi:hypothetical protein
MPESFAALCSSMSGQLAAAAVVVGATFTGPVAPVAGAEVTVDVTAEVVTCAGVEFVHPVMDKVTNSASMPTYLIGKHVPRMRPNRSAPTSPVSMGSVDRLLCGR